jgi:predicted nucleotidyltransferase
MAAAKLNDVLDTLRTHEDELRQLGVSHAAVFGSVARGEAITESDVDALVDLDEGRPIGLFEYARVKIYIDELLGGAGDVVYPGGSRIHCRNGRRPTGGDRRTLYAVIRALEIISEATRRLPAEYKEPSSENRLDSDRGSRKYLSS